MPGDEVLPPPPTPPINLSDSSSPVLPPPPSSAPTKVTGANIAPEATDLSLPLSGPSPLSMDESKTTLPSGQSSTQNQAYAPQAPDPSAFKIPGIHS